MTSFKTVPAVESGNHMGTVTGSSHDGASRTCPGSGTWHVVPPVTLTTWLSGKVWVPSIRRQMLLRFVTPAGLGRMKRCSSARVFVTPEKMVGWKYSTHDQVNRSM